MLMHQIPEPIQWHEGMLLMPQHFQQMATRYEALIQSAVASASPYSWGVLRFDYDKTALVSGLLRVLRLEAIMRDGLAIVAGSEAGIDLEINLKSFADQMRIDPLTIFVTVPAQKTLSTRGDLARYLSDDGDAIADETTGEDAVNIPRLRPRVALWAGGVPPARFESLPLMQLKAQNDAIQEQEFISPCVSVSLTSTLGEECSKVLQLARAKSTLLAGELRDPGREIDSANVRANVLALSTGLPGPEAALRSERSHPFTLYVLLCQMAGHVAAITPAMIPPAFPPYRHDDLLNTFRFVLGFISEIAAATVVESWTALPFRMVDGRFEAGPAGTIDAAIAGGASLDHPALVLGLVLPAGVPIDAGWRWGESCVIGAASLMPRLLSNRVSGAQRKRVEHISGLAPQGNVALLALAFEEPDVKGGEILQLVERFMNEGRPEKAILYIRRSETGQGRA
jgi:type VI secretion system protein ImpJ